MGGQLELVAGSDLAACPRHGWTLDLSTMVYTNPTGGLRQAEHSIEWNGDAVVLRAPKQTDWAATKREPEELDAGELTIEFWTHACCEIRAGSFSIITDPWLVGPAFSRGWWLAHRPPVGWLERLAAADAIYVSHNHSDHMNEHTLTRLIEEHPAVRFIVPAFESESVVRPLRQMGFTNVEALEFSRWFDLAEGLRVMILADTAGRDDSALLVDHRGHLILDTVDCSNPNDLDLPSNVDVLLTAFAAGATGFPVCWVEQYGEEEVRRRVAANRRSVLAQAREIVKSTRPRVVVPFAGYFKEAHPADHEISRMNVKNDWPAFERSVLREGEQSQVWHPATCERLDVGRSLARQQLMIETTGDVDRSETDFEVYTRQIAENAARVPDSDAALSAYFEWAGLQTPLLLHIVEVTEDFATVIRERFVDMATLAVTPTRPFVDHPYLRMRVRSDVFRHVMATGVPWEEISIGFQARFYREPDHYNFEFWNHFQNELPDRPPTFEPESTS